MEVRFEVEGERSLERSRFRREVDWLRCQGLLDLKIKFEEERKAMRVDPDASIGYLKVLIGAKFGVHPRLQVSSSWKGWRTFQLYDKLAWKMDKC